MTVVKVEVSGAGVPSFIQVNVSGGEPSEVQDNVRGEPVILLTIDNVVVMTGAAVCMKLVNNN